MATMAIEVPGWDIAYDQDLPELRATRHANRRKFVRKAVRRRNIRRHARRWWQPSHADLKAKLPRRAEVLAAVQESLSLYDAALGA